MSLYGFRVPVPMGGASAVLSGHAFRAPRCVRTSGSLRTVPGNWEADTAGIRVAFFIEFHRPRTIPDLCRSRV